MKRNNVAIIATLLLAVLASPLALSQGALTNGRSTAPKNKPSPTTTIDLVVFLGESEAVGEQVDQTTSYVPDPNVLTWNGSAFVQYTPGTVTGLNWGQQTGKWAEELRFIQRYRIDHPTQKLAIVKYAADGTYVFRSADGNGTWDWNTNSTYELFNEAGNKVRDAAAALVAAGETPSRAMLVFDIGINDAADTTRAAAYQNNMAACIAGFRNANSNFKIPTTAKVVMYRTRLAYTGAGTVRSAQAAIAAADTGGPQWLIDQDDLAVEADGTHSTNSSQVERGNRLYDAFIGQYTQP